ncbi:MAG: LOG family protein [Nanoarchaeota archaeon]|nr:LOG family protein [Nanoarchaeota archaeon]
MKKRVGLDDILTEEGFRVSIFGSARIKKRDKEYKEVFELARMLGEKGIDVVTGGGPGIMAAGSLGHRKGSIKTKAKSIGLSILLPHEQKTNKGVQYEKKFERFSRRLDNFMLLSNAVVVAPGGLGTMLELFYAWQLAQVEKICDTLIILLGNHWQGLVKWLEQVPLKKKYFLKKDMNLVFVAKDYKEAIKIIDMAHKAYKNRDKNFCFNYKKYK